MGPRNREGGEVSKPEDQVFDNIIRECYDPMVLPAIEKRDARIAELEEALRHNKPAQDVYTTLTARIAEQEAIINSLLVDMRGHTQVQKRISELESKLNVAQEALIWAKEMFEARDAMNAKVHCAPIRLSPITERVLQSLAKIRDNP